MSSQRKFYARETFSELIERKIKVKDDLLEVELKL